MKFIIFNAACKFRVSLFVWYLCEEFELKYYGWRFWCFTCFYINILQNYARWKRKTFIWNPNIILNHKFAFITKIYIKQSILYKKNIVHHGQMFLNLVGFSCQKKLESLTREVFKNCRTIDLIFLVYFARKCRCQWHGYQRCGATNERVWNLRDSPFFIFRFPIFPYYSYCSICTVVFFLFFCSAWLWSKCSHMQIRDVLQYRNTWETYVYNRFFSHIDFIF